MIAFWAAAGLISAATAILVLLRAGAAAGRAPADVTGLFYRRQLAEIADLADRGLIGEADRKGAEAEAGRRLLAAADAPAAEWSSGGNRPVVLTVAVAAPVLAVGLYLALGAPGVADQPFAKRLAAWRKETPQELTAPELAALLQVLVKERLKERPHDAQGYAFLAEAENASGDPAAAVQALKRGLRIEPERIDLWEMLAGELVQENGGKITPEAEDALRQVLKRDPTNPGARFALAQAQVLRGDREGGLAALRQTLASLPPGDPRAQPMRAAIAEVEAMGAAPAAGPAGPRGLTGDQLTAVRGMVQGLADRLKTSPDDPAGWVRLVRAYAVLGETDKRDAALKSASRRYAAKPDVLAQLKEAAAAAPMQ